MASPSRQQDILRLIKQTFLQSRRVVDDAVRAHGITAAQWGVLSRLVEEPGLSGAELARLLAISPQAAQSALATLEEKNLITREGDAAHSRIVRAYLTTEGKRVADLGQSDVNALNRQFLGSFSAEERADFTVYLLRLIDNISSTRI